MKIKSKVILLISVIIFSLILVAASKPSVDTNLSSQTNIIPQSQVDSVALDILYNGGNWDYIGILWPYLSTDMKSKLISDSNLLDDPITKSTIQKWTKEFSSENQDLTKEFVDTQVLKIASQIEIQPKDLDTLKVIMTDYGIKKVNDVVPQFKSQPSANPTTQPYYSLNISKYQNNQAEADKRGISIMDKSGTWGQTMEEVIPYMSSAGLKEALSIYLDKHIFDYPYPVTTKEDVEKIEKTIEPAFSYMNETDLKVIKDRIEQAKSKS